MRLSIGTEGVLGLRKLKTDALPTTAYLMLGDNCSNNCLFCPQAGNSHSREGMLSRVAWNNVQENVWPLIEKAFKQGLIKRACIQVVNQPGIFNILKQEIGKAKSFTDIPLCISGGANTVKGLTELMSLGVSRVTIALDAVTPEIYRRIKGLDFINKLTLLDEGTSRFPGRIGTHLIAGLGETEEEMVEMMQNMYDKDITVALFAFTPVKGTSMEEYSQPSIGAYRRMQVAHYFIRKKLYRKEDMSFEKGEIIGLPIPFEKTREILCDGSAFLTSGCDGCNRPYYNERPGSTMYNYPRRMTEEEIEEAISEMGWKS